MLKRAVLSELSVFQPDVVYYRFSHWNRTVGHILKTYKVFAELNSLDSREYFLRLKKQPSIRTFARWLINIVSRSWILAHVQGMACVTEEIARHNSNTKFNKPSKAIPNGISLQSYHTIKQYPYSENAPSKPGLFFMGSPNQPWHGIDLIEKMAHKMPDVDFHIAGCDGTNTSNLFWHGYCSQPQYLRVLQSCHITIGSLALFRLNMNEGSPLKVREYLAYGYPTIIGYNDTALPAPCPHFILQLDFRLQETEISPETLQAIREFIQSHKNFVVDHTLIPYIDTAYTEKLRLDFISSIVLNP